MPLPSHDKIIENIVYSPLGAPVLPQEAAISDNDKYWALIQYYKFLPIKVTRNLQFWDAREVVVQIPSILPTPEHFFVGVLGFEPRHQLGQTRFDEYLLGFNAVPSAKLHPEAQLMSNTLIDMATGDVYYEEDNVEGVVRWVVGGSCVLSIIYGLGHSDYNKIPSRHLELYAFLVGRTYYERLLSIRTTGKFSDADFQLSTDLLQRTYERFVEKSDEMLVNLGFTALTKG